MSGHPWPEGGLTLEVVSCEPSNDGEWWAEAVEVEHGELFVRIKLIERVEPGAPWLLHLYDPNAVGVEEA